MRGAVHSASGAPRSPRAPLGIRGHPWVIPLSRDAGHSHEQPWCPDAADKTSRPAQAIDVTAGGAIQCRSVTAPLEHAWVETYRRHVYVWRIPPAPSDGELREAVAAIQVWVKTLDAPYGWVNDPRGLRISVVASHRQLLAEHLRIVGPYSKRWCAGMASIVPNPILRGAGTAIGWMTPYTFPTYWCSTMDDALTWVNAKMPGDNDTRSTGTR